MPAKPTLKTITDLKQQADAATRELATREAEVSVAEKRVAEIEQSLRDEGFDPDADLDAQLAKATAGVEKELGAIQKELEALR